MKCFLLSLIFLKRSLVFPILLFFSISLHCSFKKAFLSLLAILWNSSFKWIYLCFVPLPFTFLLFSAICKASSDNLFEFLFLEDGFDHCLLYNVMNLSDLIPWIYFSLPLYNHKGFDLGHAWMAWWLRIQGFNISQATTPYIPMVIYHFASRWQHLISFSSVKPKRRDELKEVGEAVRCPGSVQFSSVAQSCLTFRDPMDCSIAGLPVHWWCQPTFLSSVVPFPSCLQSFPALGSFQMSQFSASGGQSIGVSASASVLPKNIQDWFPLGWTGWISL